MLERLSEYTLACRDLQYTDQFSKYVHGFFLPWLDQERQAGKLQKGEWSNFSDPYLVLGRSLGVVVYDPQFGQMCCKYEGEFNKYGNICGWGVATASGFKLEGSFYLGSPHGIGKQRAIINVCRLKVWPQRLLEKRINRNF